MADERGLAGYLDRWSAAPGERVSVHLSGDAGARASLDLVRLGRGGERAEPGGIRYERVAECGVQAIELTPQGIDIGSCARFDGLSVLALGSGSLALLVQPWTIGGPVQTVLAIGRGAASLRVEIDAEGRYCLADGERRAVVRRALLKRWAFVLIGWHERGATLSVTDVLSGRSSGTELALEATHVRIDRFTLAGAPHADGSVHEHFDGRIERVLLWPHAVDVPQAKAALLEQHGLPAGAIAAWEFAPGASEPLVPDLGAHGLHGRLVQGPKRAVRGVRWRGETFDWRQAPDEYAAVHFHRDDLIDASWTVSASLALPDSLASGAYAVRVRSGDGELRLPLFVRPAPQVRLRPPPRPGPGQPREPVAVVFPTFTYLAYGNDRCALNGHNPEVLADRAIVLDPTDVRLSRHPEWGLSLYDTHHDGSGVSLASRWRPIPTFHPDQRAWQAGEGSGRWNYPGDLLLVEWLEREGIAWHAFTDEDLHAGGEALLAPYRVVLTGNHPEYATPQLVAAYRAFLARGGRLMYLGGNGFYWKIATDTVRPGVIELRRAEDGNRSWAEEPGEYHHALDGSYGGMWRRNGLAPQAWLGVGYSGQGFRRSVGYERCPQAQHPHAAFVFEGVEGTRFGERGAIGGGCAGVEVDRYDESLGSDACALRLATSLPFDATYLVANEEMLVSRPTITAPYAPGVRADVVLQVNPSGGAVFATGSIAWIGGLAAEDGDAAVKRITRNVLERFAHAEPLDPIDDSPS